MAKIRKLWAGVLLVAAVPIGFMLGAATGAWLLVPADAGLAGGVMVLGYGVLGTLVTLVAGVVTIRLLDLARLKLVALVVGGLAAGVLAVMGLMFAQQRSESDAHRRQAMTMLPPFTLTLAGDPGSELQRFAYDSDSNDWRIRRADGAQCGGGLPAGKAGDQSRVELLSALRGLDVAGVLVDPPPCQHIGEVLATLEVEIREAMPPFTAGQLQLTPACRRDIPEIDALFDSVLAVYRRHRRELDCQ